MIGGLFALMAVLVERLDQEAKNPLIAVTDSNASRHPFQIFTLSLCFFIGLPLLVGEARPGSITSALPEWAQDVWGGGLVLGAALALVSLRLRNRLNGLLLEQVGLVMVGCSAVFYGVVATTHLGVTAAYASVFVLGFGLSCLWRWVQLQQLLNLAKKVDGQARDREASGG